MADETIIIDIQVNDVAKKLAENTKEIERLKAETKALDKTTADGAKTFAENQARIKDLTAANKGLSAQIVALDKDSSMLGDSLNEQARELTKLKDTYASLNSDQKKQDWAVKLKSQIDQLDVSVKKGDASIGNFQREVGHYEKINEATNSINGMKEQLKGLQDKLNGLDINSKEFKETKDVIDNLSLAVGQAEGKIDEFGNKEPKNKAKKEFEDTLVTVGILASSIGALSEAFGDNENVQEALVKTQKALILSQTAANVVKEKGAIVDTLILAKEKALTVSKIVLTGVTRIFGVTSATAWALASAGITLIITGIIMLIANFDKILGAIKRFVGASDDFSIVEGNLKKVNAQLENFDTLTKANIDRMKAQGKTEQELIDYEKKRFNEQLAMHRSRYKDLSKLTRKLTEDEIEQKKESAEFIRNSSLEMYNFETRQIEITRKKKDDDAKATIDRNNKLTESQKSALKTETDLIRQAEDANLALLKDSAEKTKQQIKITADRQIEDLKKRLKEETNLTKAAKEAIKKMIKDIETKSINDQKAVDELATKEALDRETKAQDERLNLIIQKTKEGSLEQYNLLLVQNERLMNEELAAVDLTETEKANIREKYRQKELVIEQNHQDKLAEITALAIQNDYNQQLNDLYGNQNAIEQLELQTKQEHYDALLAMDNEEKSKKFANEEAYRAAVIASENEVLQAKEKVAAQSIRAIEEQKQMLDALSSGISDVLTSIAGDDAEMQKFMKKVAIAQATMNLGIAISKAVAAGAGNPVTLAVNVGAVLSAMAGVISSIKAVQDVKPQKFASGGVVRGVGTSDTVKAYLTPKEMVLNAGQQANLFNQLNSPQRGGFDYELLGLTMASAVKSLPAPVMDYKEFTIFENNLVSLQENAKI